MPTQNLNIDSLMTEIPENYRPTEQEEFMNPVMREYFRQKLLSWKTEIIKESQATLASLQQESMAEPDITDRASLETERALELRTRDRLRKLISQIDSAIDRIDDGSFGYCEETGEPIGIPRLEARPIAKYSIEAQERHEKYERTHREDADEESEF
jgi:DnaK suppressor protein